MERKIVAVFVLIGLISLASAQGVFIFEDSPMPEPEIIEEPREPYPDAWKIEKRFGDLEELTQDMNNTIINLELKIKELERRIFKAEHYDYSRRICLA